MRLGAMRVHAPSRWWPCHPSSLTRTRDWLSSKLQDDLELAHLTYIHILFTSCWPHTAARDSGKWSWVDTCQVKLLLKRGDTTSILAWSGDQSPQLPEPVTCCFLSQVLNCCVSAPNPPFAGGSAFWGRDSAEFVCACLVCCLLGSD